jgi:phytoene dehydrogenase-like protein
MPGFHFTTFSYAVSLMRPDIVQELDLVTHGYFPLLMPHSFAPGDAGEHLLLSQDRNETLQSISKLSPHDADAYDQYGHDIAQVVQAVKPLFDSVPPNLFSGSPRTRSRSPSSPRI